MLLHSWVVVGFGVISGVGKVWLLGLLVWFSGEGWLVFFTVLVLGGVFGVVGVVLAIWWWFFLVTVISGVGFGCCCLVG